MTRGTYDIFCLLVHQRSVKNFHEIIALKGKGRWDVDNQAARNKPAVTKAHDSAWLHYTGQP